MKRIWLAALLASSIIVACAVGYWVGVSEGLGLHDLYVAPLRGGLATRALAEMKEGKTRGASLVLELQVDQGLLAMSQLDESPLDRFLATLPGLDNPYMREDELVRLANYRKANPSPYQSEEYLVHDPQRHLNSARGSIGE